MLKPLSEKRLGDPEDMVLARTIADISVLIALGLLEKVAVFDILQVTSPFLLHPNLWIRQNTAGWRRPECCLRSRIKSLPSENTSSG